MLNNKKAYEFYDSITNIYENSLIMQSIINANSFEMQDIENKILSIAEEMFIQSGSWGLIYWEELLNIKPDVNWTVEERRRNILSILRSSDTMTKNKLERIVQDLTTSSSKIEYSDKDYTFILDIKGISDDNKIPINIPEVIDTVDNVKPAHLSYDIIFNIDSAKGDLYLAGGIDIKETYILKTNNRIDIRPDTYNGFNNISFNRQY